MSESAPRAETVALIRDARLFMNRPHLLEELEPERTAVVLAPHQLVELDEPGDWVVRLGRLRFSEFLPDGREMTRSVLQAGSCFTTRTAPVADAAADRYDRGAVCLMALGEAELWRLEPGVLDTLIDDRRSEEERR